jgi:putative tryptophan/tyrosine transport system substrate-binding protein
LNRPGGNLTGVTSLNVEVAPKQLELVHEVVPMATVIGLLINATNQSRAERMTKDVQAAARQLGLRLHVLHASPDDDLDTVFSALDQLRAGALVIGPDSLFFDRREQLGVLTARRAMPAICPYRDFAVAGGLMSYGADISNGGLLLTGAPAANPFAMFEAIGRRALYYHLPLMYGAVPNAAGAEGFLMAHGPDILDLDRRASSYVDRILRGAKPSELPVQYPTKFELVVDLKTAKAIGVTIPESFLARADQVIE